MKLQSTHDILDIQFWFFMPNPSASPKDGLILLSKYFKFGQIFLTLIKSEICSNIFGLFEHGQIYLTTFNTF